MQGPQGRTTMGRADRTQLGKHRLPAMEREPCSGIMITVDSFPSKRESPSYQLIKFYKLGNFTTHPFYPWKVVEAKWALQYGGLNPFSQNSPLLPHHLKGKFWVLAQYQTADSYANTQMLQSITGGSTCCRGIIIKSWGSRFFHEQGAPNPAPACC